MLVAPAHERQAILRNLFETAFYQEIQTALKVGVSEARKVRDTAQTTLSTLLGQAKADDFDALVGQGPFLKAEAEAARKAAGEADMAELQAREAETAGKEVVRKLTALRTAQEQFAELQKGSGMVDHKRKALSAARSADRLRTVLGAADAARSAAATAATEAEGAGGLLVVAKVKFAEAEAEGLLEQERWLTAGRHRSEVERLQALASKVKGVEDATSEADRTALALDAHLFVLRDFEARAESSLMEARQMEVALIAMREAAAQQQRWSLERDSLVGLLKAYDAVAVAVQEVSGTEARAAIAEGVLGERQAAASGARDARDEAMRRYLADQAAALARELVDGAPCPVCGSLDHPKPAAGLGGAVPETEAFEQRLEMSLSAEESARESWLKAAAAAKAAVTELVRARERLGSEGRTREALDAAVLAAGVEYERSRTAAGGLSRAVEGVTSAEAAAKAAAEKLAEAKAIEADLRAAAAGAAATLAERRLGLESGDKTAEALEAQADQELQAAQKVEGAISRAKASLGAAEEAVSGAQKRVAQTAAQVADRAADAERASAAALQECGAAGFGDEALAKAAMLGGVEQQDLETEVDSFDRAYATAQGVVDKADVEARGLIMPDLASLSHGAEQAAVWKTRAAEQVGRCDKAIEDHAKLVNDVRGAWTAHEIAERALQVRVSLSFVAAGDGGGLDFEGYVLTGLLDQSLRAANRHLNKMLEGRYALRRREVPMRKAGLDIEVFDRHDVLPRSAATLSGGEGFCAALAMALGLAETVSAVAGARSPGLLAIDEGFGTLDPEALDQAINVLGQLQASNRMVGVISHVAELRERIPARIEVRSGREGSSVRIVA